MASKSKKGSNSDRQTSTPNTAAALSKLPFKPAQKRKKPDKKSAPIAATQTNSKDEKQSQRSTALANKAATKAGAIPEAVNLRMVRRAALFSGIPTLLGMLTFVMSYFVVKHHWLPLPHVAVVLVSMGWFGLGVLGLSYGALSASWDEDRLGSWHGWGEFTGNFGRLTESWRSLKQQKTDS